MINYWIRFGAYAIVLFVFSIMPNSQQSMILVATLFLIVEMNYLFDNRFVKTSKGVENER